MSTASSWRFKRPQISQALERWKREWSPSQDLRRRVAEALMDLIKDPLLQGREDGASPGVFVKTLPVAAGMRVRILYVISDPVLREITLVEIWSERA